MSSSRSGIWLVLTVLGLCIQSHASQPVGHSAQQEKKRLNNTDVIGMVKAGLAESTVLLAIEQSPSEFDTSPSALVELKSQGVSAAIMEAMMRAKDSRPVPSEHASAPAAPLTPQSSSEGKAAGVELLSEGVYFKAPTGWVKLEQISMAGGGATHVGKMFVPGLTPQVVWTFRGAEAPVQISQARPSFFVKQSPYLVSVPGHSERDVVLVRFNKKKDHRELQTTSGGNMLTFKSGFSKDKMPDINVTRLSETIFRITPNEDLQPGEYFLTFGAGGALGYDFGITTK